MKFMQIEPQPARGKLVESMWDDPDWIAEEKFDGDRRIAQFCGKVVRFTGRRLSVDGLYVEKTQNVPHLSASAKPRPLFMGDPPPAALDGTVLDGEMVFVPKEGHLEPVGGRSKHVTSIMGSLPEEAVRKQIERGWLRYVVFDCLFYKGRDVRGLVQENRKGYALDALREWGNRFAIAAPEQRGRHKRAFYNRIIKRGGEGIILKHIDQRYGDKNGWVKVKKIATYDVVIIGFKEAKAITKKKNGDVSASRIAGKVGSVEIGQFTKQFNDRSGYAMRSMGFARGFGDDLMNEMTKHPKKFLGRVVTIEANDREPTGKFRHPRVTDPVNPFRDDKKAKDCIYNPEEC